MLIPALSTDLSKRSKARPWASFTHLVGEIPDQASLATCIYLDGISSTVNVADSISLAESWFDSFELSPRTLLVAGDKQCLRPRYTINTLKEDLADARVLRAVERIECFPKGRSTTEDTWQPSAYFGLSLRAPQSAFLCVNSTLAEDETIRSLLEADRLFKSCAAYAFLFPAWFSPMGYFWGVSVEPSYRGLGAWGRKESRRLSHWRDNTQIGVQRGSEWMTLGACDGYLRDVYPIMLLGNRHMDRKVGEITLAELLSRSIAGELSSKGDKHLWRADCENISNIQQALDESGITLSGQS